MADSNNPWQSPEAQVGVENAVPRGVLTERMLRYLKEASPWLRFVGILTFIGSGVVCLLGIGVSLAAAAGSGLLELGSVSFGALGAFAGAVYLVPGVLMFFPAKFIYSFGGRINRYVRSGAAEDLEEALKHNKSLWKFSGIVSIVYLAIIPLAVVGTIITAVAAALSQ